MVDTGYYELNDLDGRNQLKKLAAAGVITYDVERFAWWETVKEKKSVAHKVDHYDWWYGHYQTTEYTTKTVTSYVLSEHFMVKVALTDNAKKYALSQTPQPNYIEEEDKDFRQPIYYDSLYPENLVDCSESWPEVKHPLADEIYAKCKAILAETQTLLDQAKDNAYSKPEQKLNTLDHVDNYNCMMSAQKAEIQSGRGELEKRIDVLKGNEAYAKMLKIHEEATTLLEKAKTCRDVERAAKKMVSSDRVANVDKMSTAQSSEVSTKYQELSEQINNKLEEMGCGESEETPAQPKQEQPSKQKKTEEPMDPQKIAYNNAKSRENHGDAILLAYVMKAVVARDIQLSQSEKGTTATAEIIYEISKVTDAERVFHRSLNKNVSRAMQRSTISSTRDGKSLAPK